MRALIATIAALSVLGSSACKEGTGSTGGGGSGGGTPDPGVSLAVPVGAASRAALTAPFASWRRN